MTMDNVIISNVKTLNEKADAKPETAFDIFGKSVAMQLKALSLENALLAQRRIQSILTEFGISDYRQRATYDYTISNYNNDRSPSAISEETEISYNNYGTFTNTNHIKFSKPVDQRNEYSERSPSEIVYASLDDSTAHITEIIYTNNNTPVDFDTCYESSDDAITAAMSATYDAMQKASEH